MNNQDSQRGAVSVKLVITLVILFLIANGIYQYVPALYNSENIKTELQAAVLQGMTLPPTAGNPVELTKKRIQNVMKANNIPPYALLEVKQVGAAIQARVAYTQPLSMVPFGIYNYDFVFDYSTKSGDFLAKG